MATRTDTQSPALHVADRHDLIRVQGARVNNLKGTATVVLRYSQPWLGGTSSEWTYSLTVAVR